MAGASAAAADRFTIKVTGKASHGARPEAGLRKERKHKENEGRQKDGESFHGNVFLVVRSKDNDFSQNY